jgi:hypothetical protein
MRFGDVIVKQVSRIAMGMSPAPTIANLFVAIYEKTHVLRHAPHAVFISVTLLMMVLAFGFTTQNLPQTRITGKISKPA